MKILLCKADPWDGRVLTNSGSIYLKDKETKRKTGEAMKKIIFSTLPMKKTLNKMCYKVDGNSELAYEKEVIFPVNAVLARTLRKEDEVKVILVSKVDMEGNSAVNACFFEQELNVINEAIGAKIKYITIATPFVETKDTHEELLRELVANLEEGAELIADITYGPKPVPIVMFAVMNFAEKFFNCKIKNIVYGKVDFISGSTQPLNPVLYDITPLYYLNSITNSMEYKNSSEAVEALDILLSLN